MVAAGDHLDDLMTLCRADITTKNPKRVKQYMRNFKKVEKRMENVVERDAMKEFQSPVRGEEIMSICGLTEGREIGEIKKAIEEAIGVDNIENSHYAEVQYLYDIKDYFLN